MPDPTTLPRPIKPPAPDSTSFEAFRISEQRDQGFSFPEAELRQQFAANPDGSVGRSLMSLEIRQAITVDARIKPDYSRYACRCWRSTRRSARSRKWPLGYAIRNDQERAAFVRSMRQRAPYTLDGNRIFSRRSRRLESSNCQARIPSCFCQMRPTCFGRYEHSRPHCPSEFQFLRWLRDKCRSGDRSL